MRTEVKVGLLICVVAVVVVAVYLMVFSGDEKSTVAGDQTATREPAPTPSPVPPPAPRRSAPSSPSLTRGGPLVLPELNETAVQTRPAPRPDAGPAAASANRPVPVTALEPSMAPELTARPGAAPTPSITLGANPSPLHLNPAPAAAQQTRTYVVREGDNGFWVIANRPEVYGAGKYWYLIQRANPNAVSERLQPGQKLTIPPLPVEARPTRTAGAATRSLPGGSMEYTVVEGDTCWTLAQRFLGDAARYEQIVTANPGIDADNLTVGQKIIIPRRTAEATPGRPAVAMTAGGTTYTIAANDTLSSIAKAHYGNEALWPAIVKANDGLDPNRLRVGATITLPSAADARRLAGVSSPSGGSTARAASGGEYVPGKPWFDQ